LILDIYEEVLYIILWLIAALLIGPANHGSKGFQIPPGVSNVRSEGWILDPRFQDTIVVACERVIEELEEEKVPLIGLVNNAGLALTVPLEFQGMPALRNIFEVRSIQKRAISLVVFVLTSALHSARPACGACLGPFRRIISIFDWSSIRRPRCTSLAWCR
jgi:hypothetical protein